MPSKQTLASRPTESFFHTRGFGPSVAETEFPRRLAFGFYALLFVAGIIFYLIWGLAYGAWNLLDIDFIGAYAVFVVLIGFGIVGMLLYRD